VWKGGDAVCRRFHIRRTIRWIKRESRNTPPQRARWLGYTLERLPWGITRRKIEVELVYVVYITRYTVAFVFR